MLEKIPILMGLLFQSLIKIQDLFKSFQQKSLFQISFCPLEDTFKIYSFSTHIKGSVKVQEKHISNGPLHIAFKEPEEGF